MEGETKSAPEVAYVVRYVTTFMGMVDAGEDVFRAGRKFVAAFKDHWKARAEAIVESKKHFRWSHLWKPPSLAEVFGEVGVVGDLNVDAEGRDR